jgi:hypothetical protein
MKEIMFRKLIISPIYKQLFIVIPPFILFVLHSLRIMNWIIDDAGISFAYSRSLASGFGLVSQPGVNPVEGFSNPSWVLFLSPFFAFHLFNPIITPKIVSLVLILTTFLIVMKIASSITKKYELVTLLTLTFLAINPSFIIWTTSGLENPLYALFTITIL